MQPPRATIDELVIGDEADAWRNAGFAVDGGGICSIGTVRVRLAGRAGGGGVYRWSLRDLAIPVAVGDTVDVDGIPTVAGSRPPADGAVHPNGARVIDHIVLMSPDGERTAAALTATTGLDVRRVRDTGAGRTPMRQRFFRMGEVILELVSPVDAADGPARFFGLTLTAPDLDEVASFYGNRLAPAKDAVQPGRRIATLRHKLLDLSVAIAFMSPEPDRRSSPGERRRTPAEG